MAKIQLEQNEKITFSKAFELFQNYNKSKNLAQGTISYYQSSHDSVIDFMGRDFNLSDFSADTLDCYINYLRDRGNKDISINSRLRGLRTMFSFFNERGYGKAINIKMLKACKPVKEVYTDAELRLLLVKPNMKTAEFDDYRNWVVINTILACGMRLSSLINIRVKDVNLDEDEIILRHTKNRIQQIIPIATPLKNILIEYLRYRKPKSDEDYLFCTWHGGQLTTDGLINAIRRYNLRHGVHKTSIHLFRHTFAKMWILNGGDILRLQKILGHRTLDMVREYVELFGADLKRDYDKFNPLSNFSMSNNDHLKLK